MPVNSHIEVPDSIIKNFSFIDYSEGVKRLKVWAYNLKMKNVEPIDCAKFGKVYGYFEDDVEKILEHKYETPFGDFKKRVYKYCKSDVPVTLTNKDLDCSIRFLQCLVVRNKDLGDKVEEKSNYTMTRNQFIRLENLFEFNYALDLAGYRISIIKTRPESKFIDNLSGFSIIFLPPNTKPFYFIPITPLGGIWFYYKEKGKHLSELMLADPEVVREINKQTFTSEKATGKQYIFAETKEDIINTLNSYKGEF